MFKGFSFFKLWWPSCSTEPSCLSNFGRGSPKEHACKIISKSIHWFRRRSRSKVFMLPTSKKLRGHIGLGPSVCPSVRLSVTPIGGCKTREPLELGT